jgi:methylase of polypeptide subunit release factors
MNTSYRKDTIVQETKELAAASRHNTNVGTVEILERIFEVQSKVFDPRIFFSTKWFTKRVSELVREETSFCEVGCGTGAVVITVLLENPTITGTAVDINEYAVENTKTNAQRFNLNNRLEVYESDVFDAVPTNKRFDSIFWAMPFGFVESDEQMDVVDLQTFDPGYRAISKFFQTAHKYLKEEGRLLVGFSKEIGTEELLHRLVEENNFSIKLLATEEGTEKSPVSMQIYECRSK